MKVLERESFAETARERQLSAVYDENERARLEKIFGRERAQASELIISTSEKHDRLLRQEMKALGLAK